MSSKDAKVLKDIYERLFAAYGPQCWWPGETPFEVIIGAILTQSTAWTNVEKAISNLKTGGVLAPEKLRSLPEEALAELIRPSGYYRMKAKKLKAFIDFLYGKHGGELVSLFALDAGEMRKELLTVYGIGEETADSIVLYAAGEPVFVIDAYTRRIMSRAGSRAAGLSYADWQKYFEDNLPRETRLFNEYHALIVNHGKNVCRKSPRCAGCCLGEICFHLDSRSQTLLNSTL
jgi:endonuclease III related protein